MGTLGTSLRAAISAALTLIAFGAVAADYPAPKEGDFIASDFHRSMMTGRRDRRPRSSSAMKRRDRLLESWSGTG